jgi:hypothetical protein
MCAHKLIYPYGDRAHCAWQYSLAMDDGVHRYERLAGRREWLGGPEATSRLERGKHLTGRAFATRVRRITGHLNVKISHIRWESRNIAVGLGFRFIPWWRLVAIRGIPHLAKNERDMGHQPVCRTECKSDRWGCSRRFRPTYAPRHAGAGVRTLGTRPIPSVLC